MSNKALLVVALLLVASFVGMCFAAALLLARNGDSVRPATTAITGIISLAGPANDTFLAQIEQAAGKEVRVVVKEEWVIVLKVREAGSGRKLFVYCFFSSASALAGIKRGQEITVCGYLRQKEPAGNILFLDDCRREDR